MEQQTIPKLLQEIVTSNPDKTAQLSKDAEEIFQPTTYTKLYEEVKTFGSGLLSLGIERAEHVGLISDNRKEWFISDLAILSIGATDVPRGCDSMAQEIGYILGFSDCRTTIAENEAQVEKILSQKKQMPKLNRIIVLDPAFSKESTVFEKFKQFIQGVQIIKFGDVMEYGKQYVKNHPNDFENEIQKGNAADIATIIFTSGTTGEPKGVMLTHRAFLNQALNAKQLLNLKPGDIWLSVLPVWHSFERVMQYIALGNASALAYSKPIGKILLQDLKKVRPTWMASVPRIWSSLHSNILRNINSESSVKRGLFHFFVSIGTAHAMLKYMLRGLLPEFKRRVRLFDILLSIVPYLLLTPLKALGEVLIFKKIKVLLGGRFIAGISGGGALPGGVDRFFAGIGVLLLEGYGLTETAPVLGVRDQERPVFGTVGPIFPNMEVKIVDEEGKTLPYGRKGIIYARGPQVMEGYYKKPEETAKVIDKDGWFNTGDLGRLTRHNEIKIVGRAKDTIVLLGGENIEPAPIEEKLQESLYIERAVVLGQDQKFLAALVLPDMTSLEQYAKDNTISYMNTEELLELPEVLDLFNQEISGLINSKNGFKPFERIYRFKLLSAQFELGRELSQKQEIKRHVINDLYKKQIDELFV